MMTVGEVIEEVATDLRKWLNDHYADWRVEQEKARKERGGAERTVSVASLNMDAHKDRHVVDTDLATKKMGRALEKAIQLVEQYGTLNLGGKEKKEIVIAVLKLLDQKGGDRQRLWRRALDAVDMVDVLVDTAKQKGELMSLAPRPLGRLGAICNAILGRRMRRV